jgi:hypothetical protein
MTLPGALVVAAIRSPEKDGSAPDEEPGTKKADGTAIRLIVRSV